MKRNDNIKVGDVVLFKHNKNNIYSRAIHRFTGGEYTHAGIVYKIHGDNKENVILAEALSNGFIKTYYKKEDLLTNKKKYTLKTPFMELSEHSVFLSIEKYLGSRYDWLGIYIIAIEILFGIKIPYDTMDKLICSEAVSRVLYESSNKEINISEELYKQFDKITPLDLSITKHLVSYD